MVQLLSPWPERDPCIITSVFLLLIACYTLAWRPRAKELAMPLLVAGLASTVYRADRQLEGRPNVALFYADLFCATFLFCAWAPRASRRVEATLLGTIIALFVTSWMLHFDSKPEWSCLVCVLAHVMSVPAAALFLTK